MRLYASFTRDIKVKVFRKKGGEAAYGDIWEKGDWRPRWEKGNMGREVAERLSTSNWEHMEY